MKRVYASEEPLSKEGFYKYFSKTVDNQIRKQAATILFNWYLNEGEDYMPNLDDIYDMMEAADDLDEVVIVCQALGDDNYWRLEE